MALDNQEIIKYQEVLFKTGCGEYLNKDQSKFKQFTVAKDKSQYGVGNSDNKGLAIDNAQLTKDFI